MIGLLLRDYDGKVTHEEMASAAIYLKDTLGKEGVQELITNLSKDKGHPRYFTIDFLNIENPPTTPHHTLITLFSHPAT